MRRLTLPERPDWRESANRMGFTFHTAEGTPYWDESAAFAFSLREIEEEIEAPSAELEEMCLAFRGRGDCERGDPHSLGIPRAFWGEIHESWQRGDRNLYGRFDFAYCRQRPGEIAGIQRGYATALFETGVFQWVWLEEQMAHGVLPAGSDQYNSVHEKLVEAFRNLRGDHPTGCISPARGTAWRIAVPSPILRIARRRRGYPRSSFSWMKSAARA